jgi:hypothetical protein
VRQFLDCKAALGKQTSQSCHFIDATQWIRKPVCSGTVRTQYEYDAPRLADYASDFIYASLWFLPELE